MAIFGELLFFSFLARREKSCISRLQWVWLYLCGGVGLWAISKVDRKTYIILLMQTDAVTCDFQNKLHLNLTCVAFD